MAAQVLRIVSWHDKQRSNHSYNIMEIALLSLGILFETGLTLGTWMQNKIVARNKVLRALTTPNDELAVNCLEDGNEYNRSLFQQISEDKLETRVTQFGVSRAPTITTMKLGTTSNVNLCVEPYVEKRHRRVKRNKRLPYVHCVYSEVREKFGRMEDSPANHMVVRKFAGDIMRKHGVRPTHCKLLLDIVVKLSFIYTKEDAMVDQLFNPTPFSVLSHWKRLGRASWWQLPAVLGNEDC